jgi:hypothetical protein
VPVRSRTVAALVAASVATAVMTTGCAAGPGAPTEHMVPAIPGVNADSDVGDPKVAVRDLQIAYNGPRGYPAGSTAPLQLRVFSSFVNPVRLTCVRVEGAAGTVVLVGGPVPTPSATPATSSPAPSSPPASPSGKKPTATPTAGAAATPTAAPTTPPAPAGQPKAPACGGSFAVTVPPAGYALLVPNGSPYLAVTGLSHDLVPGDPSLSLTFTFDNGKTITANKVPIAVPLSPAPRLTGEKPEG